MSNASFPTVRLYRRQPPFWAKPQSVSFAIAAIAVYGDLVKRLLPHTEALLVLYAISVVIIAVMFVNGPRHRRQHQPFLARLSAALLTVYLLQFLTGYHAELLTALMMLFYMGIPLAFLVTVLSVYESFDIRSLAFYTVIFMAPVHAVGVVQRFVDPNFLISHAYSENGGIIARNFLEGTSTFDRLPALFASADRYAGVAAMQFLLSFVLLQKGGRRGSASLGLFAFSLLSGATGMGLAGSRSRLLIAGGALIAGTFALFIYLLRAPTSRRMRFMFKSALVVLSLSLIFSLSIEKIRDRISEFPVLSMLVETQQKGDLQDRIHQASEISSIPEDATFFGQGLGTDAEGRPGEFAIRSMWIEGGIFWTTIMLLIHVGILLTIWRSLVRAIIAGRPLLSTLLAAGWLFWLFGLLAGFSSLFELSLALLLFPTLGVVTRAPTESRAATSGVRMRLARLSSAS
jgi:hypothetical protein